MPDPYLTYAHHVSDPPRTIENLRLVGQGLHIKYAGSTLGRFLFTGWASVYLRDIFIDNPPECGLLVSYA